MHHRFGASQTTWATLSIVPRPLRPTCDPPQRMGSISPLHFVPWCSRKSSSKITCAQLKRFIHLVEFSKKGPCLLVSLVLLTPPSCLAVVQTAYAPIPPFVAKCFSEELQNPHERCQRLKWSLPKAGFWHTYCQKHVLGNATFGQMVRGHHQRHTHLQRHTPCKLDF